MNDEYDYDYDDPVAEEPREERPQVPAWADQEAWDAFRQASRRVSYTDPFSGLTRHDQEWKARNAPSIGARARAILNMLLYPPSYITKCEEALGLYLSDLQNADRPGFWSPRRSNAPAVRGVRHYG